MSARRPGIASLGVVLFACLALAGCDGRVGGDTLSATINNQLIRLQVALEDATEGARRTRDVQAALAEQEATEEAEEGLEEARADEIERAEATQREQVLNAERAQAAASTRPGEPDAPSRLEPLSPFAGKPAEELSSTLRP
jgi:hypothetical protein